MNTSPPDDLTKGIYWMSNKVENADNLETPYIAEYQNIRKKFVNGDF